MTDGRRSDEDVEDIARFDDQGGGGEVRKAKDQAFDDEAEQNGGGGYNRAWVDLAGSASEVRSAGNERLTIPHHCYFCSMINLKNMTFSSL